MCAINTRFNDAIEVCERFFHPAPFPQKTCIYNWKSGRIFHVRNRAPATATTQRKNPPPRKRGSGSNTVPGRRFELLKANAGGFTVRSLWPLGQPGMHCVVRVSTLLRTTHLPTNRQHIRGKDDRGGRRQAASQRGAQCNPPIGAGPGWPNSPAARRAAPLPRASRQ